MIRDQAARFGRASTAAARSAASGQRPRWTCDRRLPCLRVVPGDVVVVLDRIGNRLRQTLVGDVQPVHLAECRPQVRPGARHAAVIASKLREAKALLEILPTAVVTQQDPGAADAVVGAHHGGRCTLDAPARFDGAMADLERLTVVPVEHQQEGASGQGMDLLGPVAGTTNGCS